MLILLQANSLVETQLLVTIALYHYVQPLKHPGKKPAQAMPSPCYLDMHLPTIPNFLKSFIRANVVL